MEIAPSSSLSSAALWEVAFKSRFRGPADHYQPAAKSIGLKGAFRPLRPACPFTVGERIRTARRWAARCHLMTDRQGPRLGRVSRRS
jgi:hypothetical protein